MDKEPQRNSWERIYQDFIKRNSAVKDSVVKWEPYDWQRIKIVLVDGRQILYDYMSATTEFLGVKFL
jgi:hypothetical protein